MEYAKRDTRVGWLVKGHPWDDSYGGVKLRDVIPSLEGAPHVRMVPDDWNGRSVMDTADALITCQGTAGIEFASLGKPVLVSDAGWYHDAGFVSVPRSREDYFAKLASEWWKDDGRATPWLAAPACSAGLFFCHPRVAGRLRAGRGPRSVEALRRASRSPHAGGGGHPPGEGAHARMVGLGHARLSHVQDADRGVLSS